MGALGGRNALVVGASRGIGAAVAERLAAEGANVVVSAREADEQQGANLGAVAEQCRTYGVDSWPVFCDMGDPEARLELIPAAVEKLGGRLDILVYSAAVAIYEFIVTQSLKRRRTVFEVNVHAPVDLMQQAIALMRNSGEGWIVNISSGGAELKDGPPFDTHGTAAVMAAYGASKAALNRITNAAATEVVDDRIRCNTVAPQAAVMTEAAAQYAGDTIRDDELESMECMAQAVFELCRCPADRTGRVHYSRDLIDELGLPVMSLNGRDVYPGGQLPMFLFERQQAQSPPPADPAAG